MSTPDIDKLLAEFEAQDKAFEADMKRLEAQMAQAERNTPEIIRAAESAETPEGLARLAAALDAGGDIDAVSPYGETALSICFGRNAFDAVRLLLDRGASTADHGWSQAHLAVLRGEVPEAADVMARDTVGRTPFLLACRVGNLAAARALEPVTPEEGRRDGEGEGALAYAARSGRPEMVGWLLETGYPVDEPDMFGGTALLIAVENEDAALAKVLLDAGADVTAGRNISQENAAQDAEPSFIGKMANAIMDRTKSLLPNVFEDTILTAADLTQSPEMLALLADYGLPVELVDDEDLPAFVGADRIAVTEITPEMFAEQATPRSGTANPERVDVPFWREQNRTGRSGWSGARDVVGENPRGTEQHPVWSFSRFGRTGTRLADGRWVLIAGEHEDHYDPDFHIYNDVTVIHPDARVDHYIYPTDTFPPTDFHTATLVEDHILLIGCLGYREQRRDGVTQVLRLNLSDFSIESVETAGLNPGWISRHKAVREGRHIVVSGGKIEPGYRDNPDRFVLDLDSLEWSRAQ